jgi:TPP-dependent 2-oxoacid decarboxylase
MKPKHNIGNYLINELYSLNVRHIFGLPGDYILGFYDLLTRSNIAIINTCDEQGAGFAADAYARMRGIGAVCVTYCVGGLKVLNSTAEAYAEKSPVIIISGSPGITERKKSALLHHKIRDYSTQFDLFSQVTIAATVIDDDQNAASEINRVLSAALRHKMPVYIEIPRDMIYKPVRDHGFTRSESIESNINAIKEAAQEALTLLNSSSKPILVAGVEVQRFGLEGFVLEFLEKTNIPVVSTPLSKSVLNEDHPSYLGVYEGAIGHTDVRKYVESSDCIILLGTFITDIDFGNSTTPIDQGRTINSTSQRLVIKHHVYENISTREFINALNESNQLKKFSKVKFARKTFTRFQTIENQKITVNRMFQRLNAFISSKNVVIADIGDALFGGLDLLIHKGTEFLSPAYYLSMGFAIPGSIGAQLADPGIRPVVIVGDGAFQMTGVELSTVAKLNLNPIIILMNNDGFRTERTILDGVFNDIPQWNYGKITELIGRGKSYIVKTEGQFELALNEVEKNSKEFALIEVILDRFDSSEALNRLTKTLSASVK